MLNEAIIAVSILTGLGLSFAVILAVAYKRLKVEEDPRIDQVEEMLPQRKSLMPEKVLDKLSPDDVRDLFAYLRSGQPLNN